MEFNCDICNYSASSKFNYERHLKTKKHLEKVKNVPILPSKDQKNTIELSNENEYECVYCNKIYKNGPHLSRHKKACEQKQKIIKELMETKEKLTQTEKILTKEITNEIARREEIVLLLTSENKNLKTIMSSAGTLVEKSMSNFNFLNTHYNEAPALTYVTDVPSLHVDLAEDKVASRIMNEYNNNTLTSFIGKLIVKHYKKKNPKEQSIWNSDNDRLTYMIRTILDEKTNQNQWEVDKKGLNTTLHIIQPILDHIRKHLKDYIQTCDVGSRRDSAETVLAVSRRIETAYKIIVAIKKGEVANDILKYISSRLYIVKDLDLIC